MLNTHRAVIEYAAPPRLDIVAQGSLEFCAEHLARWLAKHPVTPYSDDDPDSGGVPLLLAVVAVTP